MLPGAQACLRQAETLAQPSPLGFFVCGLLFRLFACACACAYPFAFVFAFCICICVRVCSFEQQKKKFASVGMWRARDLHHVHRG